MSQLISGSVGTEHKVAEFVNRITGVDAYFGALSTGGDKSVLLVNGAERLHRHGQVHLLHADYIRSYGAHEVDVAVLAGISLETDFFHQVGQRDVRLGLGAGAVPHNVFFVTAYYAEIRNPDVAAAALAVGNREHTVAAVRKPDFHFATRKVGGFHTCGIFGVGVEHQTADDVVNHVAVHGHRNGKRLCDVPFIGVIHGVLGIVYEAGAVECATVVVEDFSARNRLAAQPQGYVGTQTLIEVVTLDRFAVLDSKRVDCTFKRGEVPTGVKYRRGFATERNGEVLERLERIDYGGLVILHFDVLKQFVEIQRNAVARLVERKYAVHAFGKFYCGDVIRHDLHRGCVRGLRRISPTVGEVDSRFAAFPTEGHILVIPREFADGEARGYAVPYHEVGHAFVSDRLVVGVAHFDGSTVGCGALHKVCRVRGISRGSNRRHAFRVGRRHGLVLDAVYLKHAAAALSQSLIGLAVGIFERGAEVITGVVLEGDIHYVGQRRTVGAGHVEFDVGLFTRTVTVVIDVCLHAGDLVVTGEIHRDCSHHRIERISVDITRKTQTVAVLRRFGCRDEVDGRGVPNDVDSLPEIGCRGGTFDAVSTDIGSKDAVVVDNSDYCSARESVCLGEQRTVEIAACAAVACAVRIGLENRLTRAGVGNNYAL